MKTEINVLTGVRANILFVRKRRIVCSILLPRPVHFLKVGTLGAFGRGCGSPVFFVQDLLSRNHIRLTSSGSVVDPVTMITMTTEDQKIVNKNQHHNNHKYIYYKLIQYFLIYQHRSS